MKKGIIFLVIGLLISSIIFGALFFVLILNNQGEKPIKTYSYDVGEITANLANTKHFFKGKVTLELTNEKLTTVLTEKQVIIRDSIIGIILEKEPDEMVTTQGREKLKKEIIDKVTKIVDNKAISNVYFPDYIVQ